jgi:hypothetical protein
MSEKTIHTCSIPPARSAWFLLLFSATLLSGCSDDPGGQGRTPTDSPLPAPVLRVGIARVPITPTGFETFQDLDGNHLWSRDEPFHDTGVDRLWDPDEPGALGEDGKPGRAGVDDNGDGTVDDAGEYLSRGSDDVADPAGDNYDPAGNPGGTEGDGIFQAVVLAGYEGFVTGDDIRPALDIHDDLYATSLAVTRGDTTLLIVSLDLVGLWHHYMNPVKRRLEQETGVPFENIVVAATHTHAGPDSIGLWAFDFGFDTSYPRFVMEAIHASALAALENREPALMKSTTVFPASCYDRETLVMKTDPECRLGPQESDNMDPGNPSYDRHILQNDLRDPWVRNTRISAMRFDRPDGSTVASVVNFHNHPEIFGKETNVISSDYPHYARRVLEERFGGTALFLTGTVGCQIGAWDPTPVPLYDETGEPVFEPGVFDAAGNPFPEFVKEMGEAKVRSVGFLVGQEAARGLEAAAYTADPVLEIRTGLLDIVPETLFSVGFSLLIQSLDEPYPQEEDRPVRESYCPQPGCARVPVSVVRLGDASLVTHPGETAPEYMRGRNESEAVYEAPWPPFHFPAMPSLEDAMPGRDKFLIGLANAYFGYTVPAADFLSPIFQSGHPNYYEDELSAGPNFGDAVGNKIFQLLGSQERFSDDPIRP